MDIGTILTSIGLSLAATMPYVYTKLMERKMKKYVNSEEFTKMIADNFADLLDIVVTDTEMQKKVYVLGVLLGNGIKAGVGLAKKGGKFSLDGLISDGIGQLFEKGLGSLFGGGKNEQESEARQNSFPT